MKHSMGHRAVNQGVIEALEIGKITHRAKVRRALLAYAPRGFNAKTSITTSGRMPRPKYRMKCRKTLCCRFISEARHVFGPWGVY